MPVITKNAVIVQNGGPSAPPGDIFKSEIIINRNGDALTPNIVWTVPKNQNQTRIEYDIYFDAEIRQLDGFNYFNSRPDGFRNQSGVTEDNVNELIAAHNDWVNSNPIGGAGRPLEGIGEWSKLPYPWNGEFAIEIGGSNRQLLNYSSFDAEITKNAVIVQNGGPSAPPGDIFKGESTDYRTNDPTFECPKCSVRACYGCLGEDQNPSCQGCDYVYGLDAARVQGGNQTFYCTDCDVRACHGCRGEDDPTCPSCGIVFENSMGPFDINGKYTGNAESLGAYAHKGLTKLYGISGDTKIQSTVQRILADINEGEGFADDEYYYLTEQERDEFYNSREFDAESRKSVPIRPIRNFGLGIAFLISSVTFWSLAGQAVKGAIVNTLNKFAPWTMKPEFKIIWATLSAAGIIYIGNEMLLKNRGQAFDAAPLMVDLSELTV